MDKFKAGDIIEHRLMPGFEMKVQDTRDCETDYARPEPHLAYRITDPDGNEDWLCAYDVQKPGQNLAWFGRKPYSNHVAISRITLHGGQSCEVVITVSRAFLIAAIEDARSWCHEVETPWGPGRTSGNLADYDAALAVLEAGPVTPVAPVRQIERG